MRGSRSLLTSHPATAFRSSPLPAPAPQSDHMQSPVTPDPLPPTLPDKPRYELLDGLRGVAALLVIWYHFFEGFATSAADQMMNHGYLAVDFFFVLSGFVIGYAYDDRWKKGMTPQRFMLRRIVRLHPMVVLAVILGAVAWLIQGGVRWDGTPMPLGNLAVALLFGLFLIPVMPGSGADVRGNGEMFPLNGPSWSLFFEYIGSFLYAVFLRRLSVRALWIVVVASAAAVVATLFGNMSGAYHLGVGWSLSDGGFFGGFFRLSFSFSAGLLISRTLRPRKVRGAFWLCAAMLAGIMAVPYVGGPEPSVRNAVYDSAATLIFFPLIVCIGACGTTTDRFSTALCNRLGEISYPVYIIHYPAMYLFYSWVWTNGLSFSDVWPACCAIFAGILLAAWLALRFYDAPVRRFLSRKWLTRNNFAR